MRQSENQVSNAKTGIVSDRGLSRWGGRVVGLALGLGLAIGLAAPASATVIVSQPHDPTLEGKFSNFVDGTATNQQAADDFSLAQSVTLTSVSWVGQYFAEQTSLTNPVDFRIRLFDDNSGVPADTPVTTSDVSVTGVATGDAFNSSPWLAYTVALPALPLAAGNYWLSILEFDTQTAAIAGSQWKWGRASASGSSATRSGDADGWSTSSGDLAFTLEGRIAGVSEPAALALLGIGLFGLAMFGRCRWDV